MSAWVEIDGQLGEGGGQVFRSSLTLSMLTGRPVRVTRIRAGRRKSGLLRQHLTALRAATELSGATVSGAELGSSEVEFHPGAIVGGSHAWAVGSAGSASLVLQTVLLPMLAADAEVTAVFEGGTHNAWAPPAEFLTESFLPLIRSMGADVEVALERHGFFPAGGGRYRVRVRPGALGPLMMPETIGPIESEGFVLHAHVPTRVFRTEGHALHVALKQGSVAIQRVESNGPGNALGIKSVADWGTAVFSGFGRKGVQGTRIVSQIVEEWASWKATDAPVGPHLADQLLIPVAMAGGAFVTGAPTSHTDTNLRTIESFLGPVLTTEDLGGGRFRVSRR